MDPNFPGTHGFTNGSILDDESLIYDPSQLPNLANDWDFDQHSSNLFNFPSGPLYGPDADPLSFAQNTSVSSQGERFIQSWSANSIENISDVLPATVTSEMDSSAEDTDFSETIKYMSQVLMEENVEQKPSMFYDPLSLQVTEKSFFDALKENDLFSPNQHPLESPDAISSGSSIDSGHNTNDSVDLPYQGDPHQFKSPSLDTAISGDSTFQFNANSISQKPSQPLNPLPNIGDRQLDLDPSFNDLLAQNIFSDAESVLQFRRGLEEASKFLPKGTQLVTGLESNTTSLESRGEAKKEVISMEKNFRENLHGLKGRKNHEREDSDAEEGRSNKQSAVYVEEEIELSEMFDRVLLSVENVPICAEQECLQNGSITATQPSEQPLSSEKGKTRSKKQGRKKETVDLRTLLVLCAQAVSANDNRTANELLKQIREHSSPFGDASQRLAHYFANGLEARLVGASTGASRFYISLNSKSISAAKMLKAYSVLVSACPFKKFSHFFATKAIIKAAQNATTLHIIDFGIQYGFHWPILIKFLSGRDGGPPKLRITGIEYPQPGFRPKERIEETGRRLANYCKRFKVPFEYNAVASQNWETIQLEDLKIERDEFLAVNCLMRFKNLLDETIEVNSPRNAVLDLIRRMRPGIFVQSIVNGSYNAPFFVTRFREAMFHYSALYDMFETLIAQKNEYRLMYEREFLGRESMNVIACEGFERVERPETYKQWQARNTRAGFRQLPLNNELMTKFREKLKSWYHRDFVLDEDNNWMLMGWKGRILYACTSWVPA